MIHWWDHAERGDDRYDADGVLWRVHSVDEDGCIWLKNPEGHQMCVQKPRPMW